MAYYYTQFSELLQIPSTEEQEWVKCMLETAILLRTEEFVDTEPTDNSDYEVMPRFVAEAVKLGQISWEDCDEVGFQHEFYLNEPIPKLSIYAEECGDPVKAGFFVQQFLKRFDPNGYWTLSWATTCSKPRPRSFGGGCTIVFADRIEMESTGGWIGRRIDAHASVEEHSRNGS